MLLYVENQEHKNISREIFVPCLQTVRIPMRPLNSYYPTVNLSRQEYEVFLTCVAIVIQALRSDIRDGDNASPGERVGFVW